MPESNDTPALESGQIFLHFQVAKRLGVGGMGEVYLATDSKLGRKVALKILPADKMRSPESVIRFEQEARAASSLSHPNIAHIYEIGESDGLRFIAMEYVEGVALEKKIGGRPLSTAETVHLGMQIADALDEAHSQGVVHRDIKSDNVMLDRRGRVKVLDFGLAKIAHAIESEDATALKTRSGVVMGTASYMSPEQALGRQTDARTDLWSLGVILYEMTTGRLPFLGGSITETIDKITHTQPEAIARFNYEVPAELEVIIKKALRKAPDERYQSARDVLVDLKSLSKELDLAEHSIAPAFRSEDGRPSTRSSSSPEIVGQATQTLVRDRTAEEGASTTIHTTSSAEYIVGEIKRHKTGLAVAAGLLFVVIASGVGLYKYFSPGKETATFHEPKFARLTTGGKIENETIVGGANISPDGKRVVFWSEKDGKSSCWIRQISSNTTVRVLGPIEGSQGGSTFSPDGDFVYYNGTEKSNAKSTLFQIPVIGGAPPRRILDGVDSPVSFSPDGKQIAFASFTREESSLKIANADGSGTVRSLATLKPPNGFSEEGPSWSPDGKIIATGTLSATENYLDGVLMAYPADGGAGRAIATAKWSYIGRVAWLPDGSGLVTDQYADPLSTGTQLWLVSYPDGNTHRITNDLNGYGTYSLGLTSDASTIVTVQEDYSQPLFVIGPDEDPSRAKQISNGKYDGLTGIATTPDGKIVYTEPSADANNIWTMNADGTGKKPLTNDPFYKSSVTVSSDGRYIVFVSNRSGGINIWRLDIDGNNLKQLTTGSAWDNWPSISRDGGWVVFNSARSGQNTLWKVSIDGGEPLRLTDKVSWHASISPDGKFIACVFIDDKLKRRFGILPFDGGEFVGSFDIPDRAEHAVGIVWSPDGQSLNYVVDRNAANIVSQPISGGPTKPLTNFKSDRIFNFAWTRDGKQIVYSRGPLVDDVVLIKDFR